MTVWQGGSYSYAVDGPSGLVLGVEDADIVGEVYQPPEMQEGGGDAR
mgnify:CR=1 FL=1